MKNLDFTIRNVVEITIQRMETCRVLEVRTADGQTFEITLFAAHGEDMPQVTVE